MAILIRQLKIEDLKDKRQLLQITIAQAEKQGDEESIITALKEFDTLKQRILQYHQWQKTAKKAASKKKVTKKVVKKATKKVTKKVVKKKKGCF